MRGRAAARGGGRVLGTQVPVMGSGMLGGQADGARGPAAERGEGVAGDELRQQVHHPSRALRLWRRGDESSAQAGAVEVVLPGGGSGERCKASSPVPTGSRRDPRPLSLTLSFSAQPSGGRQILLGEGMASGSRGIEGTVGGTEEGIGGSALWRQVLCLSTSSLLTNVAVNRSHTVAPTIFPHRSLRPLLLAIG